MSFLDMGMMVTINQVIAEGDKVVIEAKGKARAKNGKDYNNDYCIIYTVRDGKICDIRENLDSELVTEVFGHG
ncbi:MAG TPA: hypothetical protein EYQ81_10740 [Sneathiellales bacterium]|nr:hypothetical protein [Sneathiellales bacterium]